MSLWRKNFTFLIILLTMFGLLGFSAPLHQGTVKAQPALIEYAAAHPDSSVQVIAVKSHPNSRLSEKVASLGGRNIRDLSIIHAVAAELPGKNVVQLARAPEVRYVSLDAPVDDASMNANGSAAQLQNYFLDTLNVRPVWQMGLQGQGVTIVVLDSGVQNGTEFVNDPSLKPRNQTSRILFNTSFYRGGTVAWNLANGHGTHVAGIAGGNGAASQGAYRGVAPRVNLVSLQISNPEGKSYESDVVDALQWVYNNKSAYNIRVVNLSFNSTLESSYHQSPMSAAAEILWFNGVVVVASAGNKGGSGYDTIKSAPAHDPFIITVGASDESGSINRSDDTIATFSASGTTLDGYSKPEIIAPGRNIISVLSSVSDWSTRYPANVVGTSYFRASGTSMSAPMVSAAAALLLQDEPHLTPDQVKYRLMNSGTTLGGYPYLDVYAAVTGTSTQSANTGLTASQLLWTGSDPVSWDSVSWNSVSWNSVSWNSVSWNSVSWNSVSWNSVFFGP